MPLFIRDDLVNTLAETAAKLTGTTKTEAVRIALERHIGAVRASKTLSQRVTALQDRAILLGLIDNRKSNKS